MIELLEACIKNNTKTISEILSTYDLVNQPFEAYSNVTKIGEKEVLLSSFCGAPPLWVAASCGNLESVNLLLKKGARPFVPGPYGVSALKEAARQNHDKIVNALLPVIMAHPVKEYWLEHCKEALSKYPRYAEVLESIKSEAEEARKRAIEEDAARFAAEVEARRREAERRAIEEARRREADEAARLAAARRMEAERAAAEAARIRRLAEIAERERIEAEARATREEKDRLLREKVAKLPKVEITGKPQGVFEKWRVKAVSKLLAADPRTNNFDPPEHLK